jgi:hypothetical protein
VPGPTGKRVAWRPPVMQRGIHRGALVAVWVDVTVRSKLFQTVFLTSDVVQDNAALGQSGGEVGGERHQLVETDR